MEFELIDAFKKKDFIVDLKLCRVLMENKIFPWILLIPRKANITQMNQLSELESFQLIKEINFATNIMEKTFPTDRINVAAIGNKSPQLHIHIISRTKDDPLWPETIWGQKMDLLDDIEKENRVYLLKNAFANSDLMLN
ncbi:MAG: HIT domain-containing protein [Alphaproteobacteria bacterium]|nr:HIT domain-containing protein [Alphaproteobacteria bacterium]